MLVSVTDARALGYTRCLKKEWGGGERREERGVEKKERNTIIVYGYCVFSRDLRIFDEFKSYDDSRTFARV